jgi:bifunctional UDP-N-acetylglucosamine pyrophosphorylase/glucosamine-1-phosphate N-acetyltransferase
LNHNCAAVVLAAGKGKRMKSDLPKVLHKINDRPMVMYLLDTLVDLSFAKIVVVVGHEGEQVKTALKDYPVEFVWQHNQLGTGDAVKSARTVLEGFDGITLVAAGDVPFLSAESIEELVTEHATSGAVATCLSAVPDNPKQYGRIIRDGSGNRLKEIVEFKDASDDIRAIKEVNSGTFCFENRRLFDALDEIRDDNVQGEYYLTDVIKVLHNKGLVVSVVKARNPEEVEGINSEEELTSLASAFGERH